MESLVTLLGRFHPLVVHLPIGILFLLAAMEVLSWVPRFPRIPDGVRSVILILGAVSAVVAALFGWWLARDGEYEATLLYRHRVLGVAAAVLAMAMLGLHLLRWRRAYTVTWVVTVALLTVAGHYGGSLTHGSDYLAFSFGKKDETKNIADVGVFDDVIHPILQQRCFACHGPTKSNGDLRYDSWEALAKGGKNGPSFKPGDSSASRMIQRAHLPLESKEHMPPKGKPQLTDDELALLEWWIDAGASKDLKLLAAELPVYLTEVLAERFPGLRPPVPDRAASLASALELERTLGVTIRPLAAEGPWFAANARLTGSQFGDAQLEALAPVALALSSLDLGETAVTDAGLEVIASMKNLRRLSLDRTRITDAGLQSLSGLKSLEYLNVHTTAITDAGLSALKPLTQLRSLYLWQTKVTSAAVEELGSQLVDHRRIRRLEEQIADLQNAVRRQQFNANLGISTTRARAAATPGGDMKREDAPPASQASARPQP